MRKSVANMLILATAAVSTSAVAADALSECYRTADNRLEVQACLKKELAETEKFYDDIVDRVLANARDLDRIQKRKGAAKAFEESNKAFARYLDAECKWVEASYGAGTGSGDSILACRINLMKMRAGSLDAQFLSRSN